MKYVIALALALTASTAAADQAKIEEASARKSGGAWSFSVTIRHNDTGWDHYADIWTVNTPDGKEIARRVLAHPHENEQPFTRSLSGVDITAGVNEVIIRAHDTVHGWADKTYKVSLK